jgi:hypothetical protein
VAARPLHVLPHPPIASAHRVASDPARLEDAREARDFDSVRSVAVLPISFGGMALGALVLYSPLREVMDVAFLGLLRGVAAQLAQVRPADVSPCEASGLLYS